MPRLKINNWRGIHTRRSRGQRPEGALDFVVNLVPDKKLGGMSLRDGYLTDLSGSLTDYTGQTVITSYRWARGVHPATESPTSQYIRVLCGTDGSSNKHYFQRPFWKNNAGTIDSNGWRKYGQSFATTISSVGTNTIVLAAAPATNTDDMFNGWIIQNTAVAPTVYLYVTDYVASSKTVTCLEQIPSNMTAPGAVTLYQDCHDNPTFSPSWTDPIVLKQGNNILASGGQGSTVGYKPMFSGYINKTFFPDASIQPSYNQTYVSEAEIKTWTSAKGPSQPTGYTATSPLDPTGGSRWFIGYIFETDDGQLSNLITALDFGLTDYVDVTLVQGVSSVFNIHFAEMNKRMRYLHVFLGQDTTKARTSLDWNEYFWVKTLDLTASDGWTYSETVTVTPGFFSITTQLDLSQWQSKGVDLATYLGHTEPNRTTVSFSYGVIANGMLLVAKYYDYNAGLSYNDQINYTPISSAGVSQFNKLCDLDDQLQSTVEAGDPSSIQGLTYLDGRLFIAKNSSDYFVDLTADPTQWILQTIDRNIGCDVPDSIVTTPYGIIWAKNGNGIYHWINGEPREITFNWKYQSTDFAGTGISSAFSLLSLDSTWKAWYNPAHHSYSISNGSTDVYECFLDDRDESGLPSWWKHTFTHAVASVTVRSDQTIYFGTNTNATYALSTSATQDGESTAGAGDGTAIKPFFDTGLYAVEEGSDTLFYDWYLAFTPTKSSLTNFDILIEVNSNQFSFPAVMAGATAVSKVGSQLAIVGRRGKTFRLKFNNNGTRASFGTSITILELGVGYEVQEVEELFQSL